MHSSLDRLWPLVCCWRKHERAQKLTIHCVAGDTHRVLRWDSSLCCSPGYPAYVETLTREFNILNSESERQDSRLSLNRAFDFTLIDQLGLRGSTTTCRSTPYLVCHDCEPPGSKLEPSAATKPSICCAIRSAGAGAL